jgi:DNA mismatch repair protein MLH3
MKQTYGSMIEKKKEILTNYIQEEITITKEMMNEMKVISQLDKKFIITKYQDFLFVIDQHAASERIRYENLLKENINQQNFSPGNHLKKCKPQFPMKVTLNNNEFQLLKKFESKILQWHWEFHFDENNYQSMIERSLKSSLLIILDCIPEVCGVSLSEKDLKSFLNQMEENGINIIPTCVDEVLKSKACRGAIMFGDMLTSLECNSLVKDLSNCKIPFQCAHGRPSIIPLTNLKKYQNHQ